MRYCLCMLNHVHEVLFCCVSLSLCRAVLKLVNFSSLVSLNVVDAFGSERNFYIYSYISATFACLWVLLYIVSAFSFLHCSV